MFSHSVFLLLILSYLCVYISANACLNNCKCIDTQLLCTCTQDQSQLHLKLFELYPRPNQVHVTGCETVYLYPWKSVFSAPLHLVNISNVENLHLIEPPFQLVENMHQLLISHTHIVNWTASFLEGIRGIHRIHLFNVTADQIPSNAFRDLNHVGELSLVSCTFKVIRSQAFNNIYNISRFALINSSVDVFESESFNISNGNQFVLAHAQIDSIRSRALVVSYMDEIIIRSCHISEIYSEFLDITNATSVSIEHNVIGSVHPGAFVGLSDVVELQFVRNVFSHTLKDSFSLNSGSLIEFYFDHNQFVCSQDVCWMLDAAENDELYKTIINNSTCHQMSPLKHMHGKRVSEMSAYTDDIDVCGDEMSESSGDFSRINTQTYLYSVNPTVGFGRVDISSSECIQTDFCFVITLIGFGLIQLI